MTGTRHQSVSINLQFTVHPTKAIHLLQDKQHVPSQSALGNYPILHKLNVYAQWIGPWAEIDGKPDVRVSFHASFSATLRMKKKMKNVMDL